MDIKPTRKKCANCGYVYDYDIGYCVCPKCDSNAVDEIKGD